MNSSEAPTQPQATNSSLPSSMRYALGNADAIASSTTERMWAANNGNSFTPAGSNVIRIPVSSHNGFLDTAKHYLMFDITLANAVAVARLDGDISCIIQQIRIEGADGRELERLDDYALLHNLKQYYNKSYTDMCVRNGKSGGPTPALPVFNTEGHLFIGVTGTGNFAVQIDSGFLLGHHKKALPMGMSEFTIVITLNTGVTALVHGENSTGQTYTITNARFFCPVYQIEDANVLNQYKMLASQRGISWSGDTNKLYIGALTAGASTQTIQINDRSLSLKGLITVKRPSASYQNARALTNSSTNLTGCTRYSAQIGGLNYPQMPVDLQSNVGVTGFNIARAYDQAIKTFADPGYSHSEPIQTQAKFCRADAGAALALGGGTVAGQGAMCVDLRRFDGERLSYIGLNTSKNASPNILEIVSDADMVASTTSTYAICEAEYTMNQIGRLSVQV
tara:strand:+ start:947 stop:2299 length:1353 start_codon:yes stop_codon:yes gene_type:complete